MKKTKKKLYLIVIKKVDIWYKIYVIIENYLKIII